MFVGDEREHDGAQREAMKEGTTERQGGDERGHDGAPREAMKECTTERQGRR